MTAARLRACLLILGWTQRGLARILNREEGTIRQWIRGIVQMPDEVAEWLETLARFHENNPPPRRTKTTR